MARKKVYKIGDVVEGYLVTDAGLPNTCSVSAKPIKEKYWFAPNVDIARAGGGISQAEFEKKIKPETPAPPPPPPVDPDDDQNPAADPAE